MIVLYTLNLLHPLVQEEMVVSIERSAINLLGDVKSSSYLFAIRTALQHHQSPRDYYYPFKTSFSRALRFTLNLREIKVALYSLLQIFQKSK